MNQEWTIELPLQEYVEKNHLLTIQNGYMGIRGYFSELFGKDNSSLLVIGIYDQVGDKWKEIVNQPNFWAYQLAIDEEIIHLTDKNTEQFKACLDMHNSTLVVHCIWKTDSGKAIKTRCNAVNHRYCKQEKRTLIGRKKWKIQNKKFSPAYKAKCR